MSNFYLLGYDPGTPQYTFPRRGAARLSGTCIIHTAECARDDVGEDTSAEATARFIAERADYGSYHTLVDSDSIIEMVPYEYETWQDTETNNWAVGISAALRTTDWGNMPKDREERVYRHMAWAAADFVSYMRTKGIEVPRVRISGAQARSRVPGFCAHGDSGLYRSDPGVNFDWARFFRYTEEELGGATVPQSSTPSIPKEWDELASKEDFKSAIREVIAEPAILDQIALAILKRPCHLVDPDTGQINGTTTLATKINWQAYLDRKSEGRELQTIDLLKALSDKFEVAHPPVSVAVAEPTADVPDVLAVEPAVDGAPSA